MYTIKNVIIISLFGFLSSGYVFAKDQDHSRIDPNRLKNVEKSLRPAVMDFLNSALDHNLDLPIEDILVVFAKTEKIGHNFIGYCDYFNKVVYIDEGTWNSCNASSHQALIDHELSHCLLGRVHREEIANFNKEDKIPNSVMYPIILSEKNYQKHKEYYRNELFNNEEFNGLSFELNMLALHQ